MYLPLKSGRLDFGHQQLVRKWEKRVRASLLHTYTECEGGALRDLGREVGYSGAPPGQGKRVCGVEQHRRPGSTKPRASWRSQLQDRMLKKLSYSRIYFFSLLAPAAREVYCLHRILKKTTKNKQTKTKNPAFCTQGFVISETRNNKLIFKHPSQIAGR